MVTTLLDRTGATLSRSDLTIVSGAYFHLFLLVALPIELFRFNANSPELGLLEAHKAAIVHARNEGRI